MKFVAVVLFVLLHATLHAQAPQNTFWENGKIKEQYTLLPDKTVRIEAFNSMGNRLLSGTFRNSLEDGTWTRYYPDGTVKSTVEFKKGMQHGWQQTFYQNGNVNQKVKYVKGLRTGAYQEFYANGNIRCRARYRTVPFLKYRFVVAQPTGYPIDSVPGPASVKTGREQCFYESGKLQVIRSYDDYYIMEYDVVNYDEYGESKATFQWRAVEVPNGKWVYLDESGGVAYDEEYQRGEPVTRPATP